MKSIDERQYLPNHAFGLAKYSHLKNYFELLAKKEVGNNIRSLHFLYDHKQCMISRLKFLCQNGYLVDNNNSILEEYIEIKNKISVARNLQLKSMFTKGSDEIKKIVSTISHVEQQEQLLLEKVLCGIKN